MPRAKHKPKPQDNRDFAEVAYDVFRQATSNAEKIKNPAAIELGSKGGKARDRALSKQRKSEIAKKAAEARWSKKVDEN